MVRSKLANGRELLRAPYTLIAVVTPAREAERRQQQGNKATANQSPCAQALPIKSLLPKGRLRVDDWIMQGPYNDTVKETVEL